MCNSHLNKSKSGIKHGTEVILKFLLTVAGDSYDENNSLLELLLTNIRVSRLCKAFASGSLINIKLSKNQLHEIRQSEGFLGKLLGPLLQTNLPLMEYVLKPLVKSVLIPLWLTTEASAIDAAIQKKIFGSCMTARIFKEEMNVIMEIIKSPEGSGLLIKGGNETIQNKVKERKGWFLRSY